MKWVIAAWTLAALCLLQAPAAADVYSWIDEKGVRHFSNTPPPDTTPGVVRAEEEAYNAAADQQRTAIDRGILDAIYRRRMKAAAVSEKGRPAPATAVPATTGPEKALVPKKTMAQKQRARDAAAKRQSGNIQSR